ncbi:MAG: adenylate/guanylate cyclase domain-containing protein [Pontixanthobacter sp.]
MPLDSAEAAAGVVDANGPLARLGAGASIFSLSGRDARRRRKFFRRFAIAAFLLLTSLVPPFVVANLPIVGGVERLAHDLYLSVLSDEVGMDPDISIIAYDDVTARDTRKTSPIDRSLIAKAIRAADAGGAKAIGLDFFFAQPTDDEDDLAEALRNVTIPVFMVYADPTADGGGFWSAEISAESTAYQDQFWKSFAAAPVIKSSPMIGTDSSNIVRHWPTKTMTSQPPLAAALAGLNTDTFDYEGSIAFTRFDQQRGVAGDSIAAGMFPKYSLTNFADEDGAQFIAEGLAGRYVLIGLDIFNADRFTTPISRVEGEAKIPGVAVHAHMLRQALDGNFPPPLPVWLVFIFTLLFAAAGAITAQLDRRAFLLAALVIAELLVLVATPAFLNWAGYDLLGIPVIGWALSWLIAMIGFGYLVRMRTSTERAFARDALGKYLPATVASEILDDPEKLSLEGEERPLFMLFTDLEGFTRISHSQPPRTTARILNYYLDEMSEIILSFGGTIDKFVGDAIVAFWGAPIAGKGDGPNAVSCALALHECSERIRAQLAEQGEKLGRTRIGLHYGPVIVGNFGGRRRIQYTALGDAMNTAARLEGANKYLGTDILVSQDVFERAPDFAYRAMGRILMSGVDTPISVLEPVSERNAAFAEQVSHAMAKLESGHSGGAAELRALSESKPDDTGVAMLVSRIDAISGGGAYALGSK